MLHLPLGKRFGSIDPNLYRSPFLPLFLNFAFISVISHSSNCLYVRLLDGSDFVILDRLGARKETGKEREERGVPGGVSRVSN